MKRRLYFAADWTPVWYSCSFFSLSTVFTRTISTFKTILSMHILWSTQKLKARWTRADFAITSIMRGWSIDRHFATWLRAENGKSLEYSVHVRNESEVVRLYREARGIEQHIHCYFNNFPWCEDDSETEGARLKAINRSQTRCLGLGQLTRFHDSAYTSQRQRRDCRIESSCTNAWLRRALVRFDVWVKHECNMYNGVSTFHTLVRCCWCQEPAVYATLFLYRMMLFTTSSDYKITPVDI